MFTNLGDLVRRDRDQSRLAIIDLGGDGERCFTYADLDGMARGVARALSARGYARGDRIAILSANRTEFISAYYGIMRAGFVAVPVNYRFPGETIDFIARDAGARLVVCDPARRAPLPPRALRRSTDDRHDAARAGPSCAHRSFECGVRAHGFRAGKPEPDGGAAPRAAGRQGNERVWHDRSRAGGVRPSSGRAAPARHVGRVSAPESRAAPHRQQRPRGRSRRAGNEMHGRDARLSQPGRPAAADYGG